MDCCYFDNKIEHPTRKRSERDMSNNGGSVADAPENKLGRTTK